MNKISQKALKNYSRICGDFFSFHLQWHITNECNFRCRHCYQEDYGKNSLSFGQMKGVFGDFLKIIKEKQSATPHAYKEFRLSIAGGEPVLYRHFDELMAEIARKKKNFQLNLLSNGSMLDDRMLDKIFHKYRFDAIQISLEGTESVNDAIRGKGNFRRAVKALEKIVKLEKRATISFTLSRRNYRDLPGVLNLAYDLDVPVGVRRLVAQGAGKKLRGELLSSEELSDIYGYLMRFDLAGRRQSGRKFRVYLGCESGLAAQFDYPAEVWQPGFCSVMTSGVLTPLADGKVYSCRRLPVAVGDLKKENLFNIYRRVAAGQYRLDMRKMPSRCRKCHYFSKCFGGSRCVSYAYFGNKDLYSPEPQCSILFPKLPS